MFRRLLLAVRKFLLCLIIYYWCISLSFLGINLININICVGSSSCVHSWANSSNNRCCIPPFIVLRQIRISGATHQQLSMVVIVSRLFCYVQTLKRFSLTKLLKHNNSNYLRELKTVSLLVDKPESQFPKVQIESQVPCPQVHSWWPEVVPLYQLPRPNLQ